MRLLKSGGVKSFRFLAHSYPLAFHGSEYEVGFAKACGEQRNKPKAANAAWY
jgi:hypothetical protein